MVVENKKQNVHEEEEIFVKHCNKKSNDECNNEDKIKNIVRNKQKGCEKKSNKKNLEKVSRKEKTKYDDKHNKKSIDKLQHNTYKVKQYEDIESFISSSEQTLLESDIVQNDVYYEEKIDYCEKACIKEENDTEDTNSNENSSTELGHSNTTQISNLIYDESTNENESNTSFEYNDEEMINILNSLKDDEIADFYSDTSNIKISDARKIINIVLDHYNKTQCIGALKLIHIINMEYLFNIELHNEVIQLITRDNMNESFFSFLKLYILDLSSVSETKELVDTILLLAHEVPSQLCLDILHIVWLICRIYKVKVKGNELKYFVNGIVPIKKAAFKIIGAKSDTTKFDKYVLVATSEWKPITSYIK